jgi:hypothetical protein
MWSNRPEFWVDVVDWTMIDLSCASAWPGGSRNGGDGSGPLQAA